MRGRKKRPKKITELLGNPGKRDLPDEIEPRRIDRPEPLAHLNEAARQIWERVCDELYHLGLISNLDLEMLAGFCANAARVADLERKVDGKELVICQVTGKVVTNPLLPVLRMSYTMMHRFGSEFGLSPAARTRLAFQPQAEEDEFERTFLNPKNN